MKAIITETNRWLAMRWQRADYNRELPTLYDTAEYIRRMVNDDATRNPCFSAVWDVISNAEGAPYMDIRNASIKALTLYHIYTDIDASTIHIGTYDNGELTSLVTINAVVKHCELEDDKCDAVKSLSVETECSLADILAQAASIQIRQDKEYEPLAERLLKTPDSFRRQVGAICPCCGATPFLPSHENKSRVSCNECDWVSKQYVWYLSDATDAAWLKKEVKLLKHRAHVMNQLGMRKAELSNAIDELQKLQVFCNKDTVLIDAYQAVVSEAIKKLTNTTE